jgi:hypothetical protein
MKAVLVLVLALVALAVADKPVGGKWVRMVPNGPYFPQGRFFHSQAAYGEHAVIFGGEDGSTYYRDTFDYDVQQNVVILIDSGSGPSARAGHCATLLGAIVDTYVDTNNVTVTEILRNETYVIFGGFDGTNYLNDVWELNLGTGVWTKLSPSNPPNKRAFHTCIEVGVTGAEELLVFGGYDGTTYLDATTMSVLDYNGNSWAAPDDNTPTGVYPDGRAYINGINSGGNLYIYGGYNDNDGCLDDTWVFNMNLSAWFAVPTDDTPGPLAAYAGFHDGSAYEIFGGWANCNAASSNVWSLSHSSKDWYINPPSGAIPPPRAATVGTTHGGDFLVYGGATGSLVNGTLTVTNVYDDLWYFVLN